MTHFHYFNILNQYYVVFTGVQQIHFGMDEIWRPDIYLYNNADGGTTSSFGNTHFLVHSSGEIIWVPPVKYRAFCKVKTKT